MKPLETLAGVMSRRSGADPDADVAVVGRDEPARPEPPADLDDVGAQLIERVSGHRDRAGWAAA